MMPKAYLKAYLKAHPNEKALNRVRLYVPEKKKVNGYFARVRESVGAVRNVHRVEVNPLTGSILIQFSGDFSKVFDHVLRTGLFEVQSESSSGSHYYPPFNPSWIPKFSREVEKFDQKIRHSTRGVFDLANTTGLIFIGLGFVQMFRRQVLPVASTLFLYAAQFLAASRDDLPKDKSKDNLKDERLAAEKAKLSAEANIV